MPLACRFVGKAIGEIVMNPGYMELNTAAEGGAIYAQGDMTSTVRALINDVAASSLAAYVPFISGLRGAVDALFVAVDGTIPADVRAQPEVATMIDILQNGGMGIGSIQLLGGSAFKTNSANSGRGGAICTAGNLLSFTTDANGAVAANYASDLVRALARAARVLRICAAAGSGACGMACMGICCSGPVILLGLLLPLTACVRVSSLTPLHLSIAGRSLLLGWSSRAGACMFAWPRSSSIKCPRSAVLACVRVM